MPNSLLRCVELAIFYLMEAVREAVSIQSKPIHSELVKRQELVFLQSNIHSRLLDNPLIPPQSTDRLDCSVTLDSIFVVLHHSVLLIQKRSLQLLISCLSFTEG